VSWTGESATVYNLEVEATHTYFVGVGAEWALVHNDCGLDGVAAVDPPARVPVEPSVTPGPVKPKTPDVPPAPAVSPRSGAVLVDQEQAQRIADLHALPGVKSGQNVGFVTGEIDGDVVDLAARSGLNRRPSPGLVGTKDAADPRRIVQYAPTKSDIARFGDKLTDEQLAQMRAYDSEVTLLEAILDMTEKDPLVAGHITLVTERDLCDSCLEFAVESFKAARPNITIDLRY
jgi:hypothetical protein